MKKMTGTKLACIFLCCLLFLSAAGCKAEVGSKGRIVRYDIPAEVLNLDPQYATDASARMIIRNINEGLLFREADGTLSPAVAEDYEVSADGLKLKFKLRKDAKWRNDKPVTAEDFVFAFQRMFSNDAPSPFAQDYIAIKNAAEILAGTAAPQELGVEAASLYELNIYLEHPSPYFPELLADTPAMPCNEEFFMESRGRYGLDLISVNSNGPFYVEQWNSESPIYLRPNSRYHSAAETLSTGVNLFIGNEDPMSRLQAGTIDISEVSFENVEKLKPESFAVTNLQNTVWCVVFNQNSEIWGNPLLRQGLAHTIEQGLLIENLPKKFTMTNLLVPPSCKLAGKNYRDTVKASPAKFDPEYGRRLYEMGLDALSLDGVTNAALYVPDSVEHKLAMGMLQQSWQKHLSAYINVEAETLEQIQQRFLTGDYDMLLMPVTPANSNAVELLSVFSTDSQDNHFAYHNELYDEQLKLVAKAPSLNEAADICARAESLLLQDAVIIPIYIETTAFVMSSSLKGVAAEPYSMDLYFKYSEK